MGVADPPLTARGHPGWSPLASALDTAASALVSSAGSPSPYTAITCRSTGQELPPTAFVYDRLE